MIHEGFVFNDQITNSIDQVILKKYYLQKRKYIIFVGTVQPRKNLERLICATANMNTKLVIAGKLGWQYQEVQKLVNQFEGRVVLLDMITMHKGILCHSMHYFMCNHVSPRGLGCRCSKLGVRGLQRHHLLAEQYQKF